MIKYLGSKRRLVPALAVLAEASGAVTALDLFCGTTRVSQAFKARGIHTTAVDSARCAHVLARCYVATDPDADRDAYAIADSRARAAEGGRLVPEVRGRRLHHAFGGQPAGEGVPDRLGNGHRRPSPEGCSPQDPLRRHAGSRCP